MSRIQLALNVPDLDEAVDFYSRLFGTEPHKRKPGYANFAVADPPLKLVLFEAPDAGERLNHLGIEALDADSLAGLTQRWNDAGLVEREEEATACCHAVQDKAWTSGPDGTTWEAYRILEDSVPHDPTLEASTGLQRGETPRARVEASRGVCCG